MPNQIDQYTGRRSSHNFRGELSALDHLHMQINAGEYHKTSRPATPSSPRTPYTPKSAQARSPTPTSKSSASTVSEPSVTTSGYVSSTPEPDTFISSRLRHLKSRTRPPRLSSGNAMNTSATESPLTLGKTAPLPHKHRAISAFVPPSPLTYTTWSHKEFESVVPPSSGSDQCSPRDSEGSIDRESYLSQDFNDLSMELTTSPTSDSKPTSSSSSSLNSTYRTSAPSPSLAKTSAISSRRKSNRISLGATAPVAAQTSRLSASSPTDEGGLLPKSALLPLTSPQIDCNNISKQLSSTDWNDRCDGLTIIRQLSSWHRSLLIQAIKKPSVYRSLRTEVESLRSVCSRTAITTINELVATMSPTSNPLARGESLDREGKGSTIGWTKAIMEEILTELFPALLRRASESGGAFISGAAANAVLGIVTNGSPFITLPILLNITNAHAHNKLIKAQSIIAVGHLLEVHKDPILKPSIRAQNLAQTSLPGQAHIQNQHAQSMLKLFGTHCSDANSTTRQHCRTALRILFASLGHSYVDAALQRLLPTALYVATMKMMDKEDDQGVSLVAEGAPAVHHRRPNLSNSMTSSRRSPSVTSARVRVASSPR